MSELIYPTSSDQVLGDQFGRSFPYLRLSITDVCNFRCSYCLPDGYQCSNKLSPITLPEIRRLVDVFASLGVQKIRITGGEPTVRKDFVDISALVSSHPSITQTAFTTNGYRLQEHAAEWREAGLSHINVSIDSLKAQRFHEITGHDRLDDVLAGVEAALKVGFEKVKINVVLLKGINDQELPDFLALAKRLPVSIRFIELMQTGDNEGYFQQYHLPSKVLKDQLLEEEWLKASRSLADGPAEVYSHSQYQGSIGFIAPYEKDFCLSCNRLRVTSTGDLRLCLFGNQGISLRHLLQEDEQKPMLLQLIQQQLAHKASSHFLAEGDTGITPHLASVGG